MKKVLFIILLLSSFFSFSQTSSCVNADFELGNFNGWNGQTGSCCPINTTPSTIIAGRHTIMSGTGTDPYTCNTVPVVAPGGLYSARLGNSSTGRQAEKLSYTIPNVTSSNALFIYKYAVVFQDPTHTAIDQPRFEIKVYDSTNQIIDPTCGQYSVVSNSTIPGFQTCSTSLSASPIRYKNWTTVGLNLTPYIGRGSITIEFATGDCDLGGHFGYAYIDAYCSPLSITTIYCSNSTSATLSAPPGFSYLWSTGETTQNINVTNPTVGAIYTCVLTSVTGCIVNLSTTLSVGDPVADFSITNNCFSNTVFSSALSITPASSSFTNFLWNFGDGTTSTSPNPTHSYPNPGNYIVTLTLTNSLGCVSVKSDTINVINVPTASISYTSTSYCINNSNIQSLSLTGTGAFTGGTYTSSPAGLTLNSTTGEITPNTSLPNNYTITYNVSNSNGCNPLPATTTVAITAIPTATITYAGAPFCTSLSTAQAVTLNGTGAYTGGTYTSTPAGLSINSTTGAIIPSTSTPGNYVVTYTTLASGGCASIQTTTNVTITAIPTATIVYANSPFCTTLNTAQAVTLNGTLAYTGGAFTSTTGLTINATTGDITPNTSTPGNYVVTYSTLAAGGCPSVPVTTNVVITATPTATITYAGSPFCASLSTAQAVNLNGTRAYTGGTYTSTPTGLTINSTTGAITPSTSAPGNYVVTYTTLASGGCSQVTATTPIEIKPVPVATAIQSANTICSLSSATISLSSNLIGTTFNWTIIQTNVTGATIGSGNLINQTLTNSSFTPGNVIYEITPTANGCVGSPIQSTVIVNPIPDAIANPNSQNICSGQSTSINLSGNVLGTTFNWTVNQTDVVGANPGSGNSINQILNSNSTNFGIADYTITPTANNCIGNPINVRINITPKPVIVANPNQQIICSGDTIIPINLSSNITGTTYNWSVIQTNANGATNGSGSSITQTLTNNNSIQGEVLYNINSILNSCPGNSTTALVKVNPRPTVTSNSINQSICSNENTNITLSSNLSATTFSWLVTQNNVTGALSGSGNNINQILVNNNLIPGLATYNVTPVDSGCIGLQLSIPVIVKPIPQLTNISNPSICSNQTTNIPLTSTVSGSTFSWTSISYGPTGDSNGTGNQIAQQLQNSGNSIGIVNYTVSPISKGCTGNPGIFSVRVLPLPKPILTDGAICVNASGSVIQNYLLDSGLGNLNNTFNWTFNGNPIPNSFQSTYLASVIGTYTVVATNTITGCVSSPAVSAIVSTANPAISLYAYVENNISNSASVTVIVNSGTGPFLYQLDNGPFQTSNVFTLVPSGLHTITVQDAFNCTNLKTSTLVIDFPNYFTPNGDNYNDYWNIYGIQNQPSAKIYIFDRYGKLITQLNPLGQGWDGNYNGNPLPATDYWFVLEYIEKDSSGSNVWRTFKSHFSLLR
jgi:gliding motility-associated-like protein